MSDLENKLDLLAQTAEKIAADLKCLAEGIPQARALGDLLREMLLAPEQQPVGAWHGAIKHYLACAPAEFAPSHTLQLIAEIRAADLAGRQDWPRGLLRRSAAELQLLHDALVLRNSEVVTALSWLGKDHEAEPVYENPLDSQGWSDDEERVGFAILQAIHVKVPVDKRPQAWMELSEYQLARFKAAAQLAILYTALKGIRPVRDIVDAINAELHDAYKRLAKPQ